MQEKTDKDDDDGADDNENEEKPEEKKENVIVSKGSLTTCLKSNTPPYIPYYNLCYLCTELLFWEFFPKNSRCAQENL